MRLIVTGAGCSGTKWAAKALTLAGVECGHERAYTPRGPRLDRALAAESSWCAAPYLDGSVPTFLLVRNPLAVVRSAMAVARGEFLHPDHPDLAANRYVADHMPDLLAPPDQLTRVTGWVALWDQTELLAESAWGRVEDNAATLATMLGLAAASVTAEEVARICDTLGNSTNTHGPVAISDEEILGTEYGPFIEDRLNGLGYTLDVAESAWAGGE